MTKFILILLITTFSLKSVAAEVAVVQKVPIEIISDEVKYLASSSKAYFHGNVVITQKDLEIITQMVEVDFSTKAKSAQQTQVNQIIFASKVNIKTIDQVASADSGCYYVSKGVLKLKGHVLLEQNGNTLAGDELTYIKATGETLLKSNNNGKTSSRVKALILPKKLDRHAQH